MRSKYVLFSLQVDIVVLASVITSKALTLCSHKKKMKQIEKSARSPGLWEKWYHRRISGSKIWGSNHIRAILSVGTNDGLGVSETQWWVVGSHVYTSTKISFMRNMAM